MPNIVLKTKNDNWHLAVIEVVASSLSLGEIFSIAVDLGKIRHFFIPDLFSSNCFLGRRHLF